MTIVMLLINRSLTTLKKIIVTLFPLSSSKNRCKARWWGLASSYKCTPWNHASVSLGKHGTGAQSSCEISILGCSHSSSGPAPATCSAFGSWLDQTNCNQHHAMLAIPETGMTQVSRIPELCLASTTSCKVNGVFSTREWKTKLLLAHFIWLGTIWQSHSFSQLNANPFLGSQGRVVVIRKVRVEAVPPLSRAKEFIEASPRRQSKHQAPPVSVKSNCITFYGHTADIIE